MIDTLFSLVEAHLFMQLVELQDSRPRDLPKGKTYTDLYRCQGPPPPPFAAPPLLSGGLSPSSLRVEVEPLLRALGGSPTC